MKRRLISRLSRYGAAEAKARTSREASPHHSLCHARKALVVGARTCGESGLVPLGRGSGRTCSGVEFLDSL